MKECLNNIRSSNKELATHKKIMNTFLIFVFGIALGIFSKWLDNMAINDSTWWQRILGILDLRNIFSNFGIWIFLTICISLFSNSPRRASINVFLFFVVMTIAYHLYTILFCDFNPARYMMIWYGITIFTPILAYICHYAKGNGKISFVINACIMAIILLPLFAIGMWYFDFQSLIDTLLFIGAVAILHSNLKRSIIQSTCKNHTYFYMPNNYLIINIHIEKHKTKFYKSYLPIKRNEIC